MALLRPLLKKPGLDVEDMNSFRPVSNLSFLSKIVERAMLDQLLPFLEENRIIPKNQSAYRQFHSTETALCKIHNDLVTNACSGKVSLLVLLDLSAAFDTVDHDVLLADLFSCSIREDAHSLLKSYLTNRFQHTSVGASLSEPVHLQFGIPQGFVLGPILFTLLSSPIGGASTSYFKNFCPRPRSRPRPRSCPRVIWFFRTITLESLNQSEPNFHT